MADAGRKGEGKGEGCASAVQTRAQQLRPPFRCAAQCGWGRLSAWFGTELLVADSSLAILRDSEALRHVFERQWRSSTSYI